MEAQIHMERGAIWLSDNLFHNACAYCVARTIVVLCHAIVVMVS